MKKLSLTCLLAVVVLTNGCKKPSSHPEPFDATQQRDVITYKMTVLPRAETAVGPYNNNHNGDTLIVKINGTVYLSSKGSVADTYGTGTGQNSFPTVKTGDIINIYYNPGKVSFNGGTMIDENGLQVYLDYNNNNNILWKEFKCRCIGNFEATIP